MNHARAIALTVTIFASAASQADVVVAPAHDNIGGTLTGAAAGMLVGGFVGGPLGAFAGAGIGALSGRYTQDAAGMSQRAYVVETAAGEQVTVRSPKREFEVGQSVRRNSGRLHATEEAVSAR